jgi:predicted acyltransferase
MSREIPQGRLQALDILRGMAIAGMILVNTPGDWGNVFSPLLHADWHGWTPTDLVFPFFLFCVGMAIPLSLGKRMEQGGAIDSSIYRHTYKRTAIIFALGLALNWFPFYTVDWSSARIPGVLQRIAIVYLLAVLSFLHLEKRGRAWLTVGLLGGYWALMKLVPAPGFGAGDLSPAGNLAAWVDTLVFGDHVLESAQGPGDPEGLLSTVPAIATALLGIFAGEWMRSSRPPRQKLAGLCTSGVAGIVLGLAMGEWFPINKKLWTSSYVLLTAGLALALLAGIYWLVDMRKQGGWAKAFNILGMNSIAAYVGSGLLARLLYLIHWTGGDGSTVTLKGWLYGTLFEPFLPPQWASLAWALVNVGLWIGIAIWMYRRRLFIKI